LAISSDNWAIVRDHYDRGKGPTEIARIVPFKITRQAIEQRARREEWKRGESKELAQEPAQDPVDIPKEMLAGLDPIKAAIAAQVAAHGTISLACRSMGVPESTFRGWRKSDPNFAATLDRAQALANGPVVANAYNAAKTDPKYAWEWLQKHPSTREEFGRADTGPNIGQVKIGKLIQRGDGPSPVVIDQG